MRRKKRKYTRRKVAELPQVFLYGEFTPLEAAAIVAKASGQTLVDDALEACASGIAKLAAIGVKSSN